MTHKINTSETQINTEADVALGYDYGTILLVSNGDYNTRQLRSHERDGYAGRNIGGITTTYPGSDGAGGISTISIVSGENIGLADGTYTDKPVLSTTSARGSGATFNVTISNTGENISVVINNSGQLYLPGDTVRLSGAEFDSTEGNDIVLSVSNLAISRVNLNLIYQVQKLSAGYYALEHGYEGQIMYFTPSPATTVTAWASNHCSVLVKRGRLWGATGADEYDDAVWWPFEDPNSSGAGPAIVYLMYIDGAWVASGGVWD
jgi:hypothetical protein